MITNSVCEFIIAHRILPRLQLHYSAFARLKNMTFKLNAKAGTGAKTTTIKAVTVSLTLDRPRLLKTDDESVRLFLKKYDQYISKVVARGKHVPTDSASSVAVTSVGIKFRVDPKYLESPIAIGSICDSTSHEYLTDQSVCGFKETKSSKSKEAGHSRAPRSNCSQVTLNKHKEPQCDCLDARHVRWLPRPAQPERGQMDHRREQESCGAARAFCHSPNDTKRASKVWPFFQQARPEERVQGLHGLRW